MSTIIFARHKLELEVLDGLLKGHEEAELMLVKGEEP